MIRMMNQPDVMANNKDKRFLAITYLIYMGIWSLICFIGTGVFITMTQRSGKWMLLAAVIYYMCWIRPHVWYSIWDGVDRSEEKDTDN